ncbi:cytosolic Cu/Zn superoxide dismutase [Paracoccidioides lutzii Pb01]|uniref:superoxide dismutase n=2 Tax=Paracoccidioides TaxID=38946 RepID=C1GY17_PARBA|nr:cytosolic Cu/Zn superoxide dismutase [Paracoccidioides lutzii Pb01]ABH03017.1 Cu-Zn superoxide dismutase [Paracoccidioides brasiliensis]EEH41408.1 cytosolic Cu/Zn superoxide dismutase [Paracoccidioides lutzii Pb01]
MKPTFSILACSLGFALRATAQVMMEAVTTENNPMNAMYQMKLMDRNDTTVRGIVNITSGPGGLGVMYSCRFWGFPNETENGPFPWHVHDQPVSSDGNCNSTLAHLDLIDRGEFPPCNASNPKTCQEGDMSGKYGNITNASGGNVYEVTFIDNFTSLTDGLGAFVGNRSMVVHYRNSSRINCGNITLASINGTAVPTPSASQRPSQGPANRVGAFGLGVMLAGVAAMIW